MLLEQAMHQLDYILVWGLVATMVLTTVLYGSQSMGMSREPPGFMGLNYGRRTPLTTLAGHTLYGVLLGYGFHFAQG